MRFLAAKDLFLERSVTIEKEIKITRKYMKETDAFKTKIIGLKELLIGTMNYDCNRLLTDLDFKEKSIVKGAKLIETKLKRQNVSETIIDTIKNCFLIIYQANTMVFMIYI